MRIIMIECGKQKVSKNSIPLEGISAKDLYTSDYYRNNKAYATKFYTSGYYDTWLIFSTKYGVIPAETKIHWYEVTPWDAKKNPKFIQQCEDQVQQLNLTADDELCVLAGDYDLGIIEPLFAGIGITLKTPLAGIRDYNQRISIVKNQILAENPF